MKLPQQLWRHIPTQPVPQHSARPAGIRLRQVPIGAWLHCRHRRASVQAYRTVSRSADAEVGVGRAVTLDGRGVPRRRGERRHIFTVGVGVGAGVVGAEQAMTRDSRPTMRTSLVRRHTSTEAYRSDRHQRDVLVRSHPIRAAQWTGGGGEVRRPRLHGTRLGPALQPELDAVRQSGARKESLRVDDAPEGVNEDVVVAAFE